jgi:hypothetical protein
MSCRIWMWSLYSLTSTELLLALLRRHRLPLTRTRLRAQLLHQILQLTEVRHTLFPILLLHRFRQLFALMGHSVTAQTIAGRALITTG